MATNDLDSVRKKLIENGHAELAALLENASIRIVEAPEIGCMAVVKEHCCEIRSPSAQFFRLNSLTQQQKELLLETVTACLEASPTLNITLIEFHPFS